ncbi:MAG TPA: (Fe-S)-binding protein [Methanomassiliicoccales archaeon]|nr:(Fe-S)-binding protein [Methanomassiliicoccales archaeon]
MTEFQGTNLRPSMPTLTTCTYCGFCKSVCPAFESIGWEASVARGRMILAYGLLRGDIEPDESVVRNIYQCTTCKDCERRCPSNIEVVDVVERCRRDLVTSGVMMPAHKSIADSVATYGNPYGESRSVADAIAVKKRRAKIGYFVGCTAGFRDQSIARSTMTLLDSVGADFTVVDDVCCGSVLQRIGMPEDFVERIMRRNIRSIQSQGVEEVVFSCAGCYRMFREEYPKFIDVGFEVKHVSQLLAGSDLRLRPMQRKITYHDPCHLGRHSKVYDEPRKLLDSIPDASFKEMPRKRETAACCGGGGGVRSAFPDLSRKIAGRRVEEASFADVLVTTCPFCVSNLRSGREETGSKVEIMDLSELLASLVIAR